MADLNCTHLSESHAIQIFFNENDGRGCSLLVKKKDEVGSEGTFRGGIIIVGLNFIFYFIKSTHFLMISIVIVTKLE